VQILTFPYPFFKKKCIGLCNPDDIFLTEWNASILGPQGTPFDGRLYELHVIAGPDYPNRCPEVRFVSKVNLAAVNPSNGVVSSTECPQLSGWNRNMTLESVLVGLKNSMTLPQNRRLPQPAEGSRF